MNHSMISSMVTMSGLQQKLDILANNIANINTTGYKRKEATFEDILTNIKQQPQGFEQDGRLSPLGFTQTWGAKLSQVTIDLSPGILKETGLQTDLAIEGDGLFKVRAPGGETLYTRDGAFNLTHTEEDTENVYLATKDGYLLLDSNDEPIAIPNGDNIVVDEDGVISSYNGSAPEEGTTVVGQLGLVRILRPQYLQEVGDNLFTVPAGITANQQIDTILQPIEAGSDLERPITVRQGFMEQSNTNLTDEMTELLTVQRAFQLNSRALTSADTMMGLVNNLRG